MGDPRSHPNPSLKLEPGHSVTGPVSPAAPRQLMARLGVGTLPASRPARLLLLAAGLGGLQVGPVKSTSEQKLFSSE